MFSARCWRPCVSLAGQATYVRQAASSWQVSSHGRVRSSLGVTSYGWMTSDGYRRVRIERKSYLVHRLVAVAFLGPPSSVDQWQVNHMDGNRSNNCVTNLQYATGSENARHAWTSGGRTSRQPGKAVLWRICGEKFWASFPSQSEASRVLGVSAAKVSHYIRNAAVCHRNGGDSLELKAAPTSVVADLTQADIFQHEVWKNARHAGCGDPIENLMISDHGRIRHTRNWAVSRGSRTGSGYYSVQKNNRHYLVHRLVAGTFLGQPSAPNMQVNHKDGDRQNNHVQNLEYVTPSQNIRHSYLLRDGQDFQTSHGKPVEARLFGTSSPWLSFETIKAAAEYTKVGSRQVSECCKLQPGGGSYGAWEFRFSLEEVLADEEWRPVVLLGASAPGREHEIK